MTTPVLDVQGNENGTVTVRVQVQNSDATPADLDGFTGTMQVRPDPLSDDVLATGVVTFGSDGLVTGQIPAGQTGDWTVGYYDIRITDGTVVEYVAKGRISLTPTVTAAP